MAKRLTRRKFLGVSTTAAIGATIGGAIAGGAIGYYAGVSSVKPEKIEVKVPVEKKVKAGFVYVGPAKDYGWSYAHDRGRLYAEEKLPWLETIYIESVQEAEAAGAIENLLAQGADIVFTTSFGYMDQTAEAAAKHPDKFFAHCSGYRSGAAGNAPENMSAYFAEFYQLYYLNGLAAGAVTKTGVAGYVAAHPIPEVIRHINAFVLGFREAAKARGFANPKAYVVWIFEWFDPAKAREAAESLIESQNADVLAFTEDSPATLQVAEEYTTKKGKRVWSFSHYSDMSSYGPNSHLTGQIVNWGPIYVDLISQVYRGYWRSVDIWARIGDYHPYRWRRPVDKSTAGTEEGVVYLAPLNPAIPSDIVAVIKERYEAMKELLFEPFTGPIYDNHGVLRLKDGERADHDTLWSMDWFVEGVESEIPKG